ncbi:MAG TPA: hypothetical protein VFX33_00095 [Actinomycetales bacterium]|nr:hypothetical protein [Actinomycetales bacterium]
MYEIAVGRRVEARLPGAAEREAVPIRHAPEQTVICLRNADQEQMQRVIDRLADLRIEVSGIRRCAHGGVRREGDGEGRPLAEAPRENTTTYEVSVLGRLGPVLLCTFPHDEVRLVPAHTVLLLRSWDAVVRVLEALVAADVPIQYVWAHMERRRSA